ncbi:MAG: hydantoinase/oxoprolinase family protein [Planctomycetaceae bacterium]
MMRVVGCDIGGANIKMADSDQLVRTRSFEIWNDVDQLSSVLREMLNAFQTPDCLVVTLTAELADCFQTKSAGVDRILQHVEVAAGDVPVRVWQTGCEFVTPEVAREIPLLVAAANWHALATWVGRMEPDGPSLLIDVGSTTTDIVPLFDGVPVPMGLTDRERIASGELVYSGVWRTPVCAISRTVIMEGHTFPLAAEVFATALDVYLILEDITPQPNCCRTANGRPAIRQAAIDRLLRMCCCDRTEMTEKQAVDIAGQVARIQLEQLQIALRQVIGRQPSRPQRVLVSGSGEFLARRLVEQVAECEGVFVTSLSEVFHPQWAEAACACAVARLGAERLAGVE